MIERIKDRFQLAMNNTNFSKAPFYLVTAITAIGIYLWLRTWFHVIALLYVSYTGLELSFFLFGNGQTVTLLYVVLTIPIWIYGWLLSTRVSVYRTNRMRTIMLMFTITYTIGNICWYGMSRIYLYVLPFLEQSLDNEISGGEIVQGSFVLSLAIAQRQHLYFLLMLLPLILVGFVAYFFLTKYHVYEHDLKEAFFKFEWTGQLLQRFARLEHIEYAPDIELGVDVKTNEKIILYGHDRTLNSNITGPIGTGKSAALAKPTLNQDLHHMTKFINEFKELYSRKDYLSKHVSGRYLNGISVIDPSNDLCKDIYKLAKAHNIPDEAITYIDPTNPDTPSINPMRGPVDKVAEVFAQVIAGLSQSQGGNDFFKQAQRNHLKQYIYLLKEHNPDEDVTFDMLLDMYNNPQVAREKHVQLKKRFPENISRSVFKSRDEYNYWQILKGIDEWFDMNLVPKTERNGDYVYDENANIIYEDAEAEYVKNLRNILNDIGANPLIRRVMFGTSEFDFDRHFAIGGVLLVNTAKGELEELSKVLGKIVLMNLQNATFRREPNVSTYHHILVDEAPEYLYPAFKSFGAQSRKYKVIVSILEQTLAQLSDEYGETFKTILLASYRNKMFYGDLTGADAKEFAEISGEQLSYKEGENEQEVSALQEDPSSRSGASYQKQVEQLYTANQLIYQEAFNCAVKIVERNKPMPVRVIMANFVPDEEYEVAKVQVDPEALEYWLEVRREFGQRFNTKFEGPIRSIEETEEEEQEIMEELGLPYTDVTEPVSPVVEVKYDRAVIEAKKVVAATEESNPQQKDNVLIQLMSQPEPTPDVSSKNTMNESIEENQLETPTPIDNEEKKVVESPPVVNGLEALIQDYQPLSEKNKANTGGYLESKPTAEQDAMFEEIFGPREK